MKVGDRHATSLAGLLLGVVCDPGDSAVDVAGSLCSGGGDVIGILRRCRATWLETSGSSPVMLSLLAIVCASTVRIMVPGGLDGYWQQKIKDFEDMKKEQGEDVTVLMDPVDSTIHFESVANEISAGLDLTDGFVIMASWLPDFLEGLKDVTDMVKERVDMNWNDVLPFVRDKLCSYDQRVYLVPVDLDMMSREDQVQIHRFLDHFAFFGCALLEKF